MEPALLRMERGIDVRMRVLEREPLRLLLFVCSNPNELGASRAALPGGPQPVDPPARTDPGGNG